MCCVLLAGTASARTFEFKIASSGKSQNEGDNNYWRKQKTKFVTINANVGKPTKKDCLDEMELRAATVMKDVRDKKKMLINDIKVFKFLPINDTALHFKVISATASASIDRDKSFYDSSYGSEIGALVVEFWQGGKCVKHWASATGPAGKIALDEKAIEEFTAKDGNGSGTIYFSYYFSGETRLDKDERVTKILLEPNEDYANKIKEIEAEADKKLQEEELKPSDIAPAIFLSEKNHAPVVYKLEATLMDSSNAYAVPRDLRESHWCVQLRQHIRRETDGHVFYRYDYFYGLVLKDSALGKRMKNVIQDGHPHSLLVKIARHAGAEEKKVVDILNFKVAEE